MEEAELKVVGHLKEFINVGDFTGINFKVPVLDHHSPLALSIAMHLHYVKYPHKGAETLYRMSLQFVHIINGRSIFRQISEDCVYCKILRKKYLKQVMGPLQECQTSISPVFYYTLVDLWGPLRSYVKGYEKTTRSTAAKPHEVYMMVFVCAATGCINVQAIEGRDTDACSDGMNRFFNESSVPKIMFADEDGGLVRSLKHGKVDILHISGVLAYQRGITFRTVVPQGHSAHGRAEKRIHMLQLAFEESQLRGSRCTSLGWQTLGKMLEHTVNSVPLGYLFHDSGGINPLLKILTPNSLKLVTSGDRAPASLFKVPDSPRGLMTDLEDKYQLWYQVWNDCYLPKIMNRSKWHFHQENLQPGDVVFFKLTESKMSSDWRLGKVEEVKVGDDGFVRKAKIAYKDSSSDDPEDWMHRTVNRPVRNIVKLFHVDDTSLLADIQSVLDLSAEILEEQKISPNLTKEDVIPAASFSPDAPTPLIPTPEDDLSLINLNDEFFNPSTDVPTNSTKKNRELDRLRIDMKGWNAASTPVSMAAQFLESTCFQDETFSESENFTNFIDGNEDIQWKFSENFDDDSLNVYLL